MGVPSGDGEELITDVQQGWGPGLGQGVKAPISTEVLLSNTLFDGARKSRKIPTTCQPSSEASLQTLTN
jgi:hypothetical protein